LIGALTYGYTNVLHLIILFTIGFFSHIYGFVLNDYLDVKIDKLSKDLHTRPLVKGTIKFSHGYYLAVFSLLLTWFLAFVVFGLVALLILLFADLCATIYNIISKKYAGMDVFVSSAILFLILFGGYAVSYKITTLLLLISIIGFLQVFFMNAINGGLKDIDHDVIANARTIAVKLGVRVKNSELYITRIFKTLALSIEFSRYCVLLIPIFLGYIGFKFEHVFSLVVLEIFTLYSIYMLLDTKIFIRNDIRKKIGIVVIFMWSSVPVLLSIITPFTLILAFIPPCWFLLSNLLLHKVLFEPQTM